MNIRMNVYKKDGKRVCLLNELSQYEMMLNHIEYADTEDVQNGDMFAYELDNKIEEMIDMMYRSNKEEGLEYLKALIDVYEIKK